MALKGYAYFGSNTPPCSLLKLRLSDFTIIASIDFAESDGYLTTLGIDPKAGYIYAYFHGAERTVHKIKISTFTVESVLTLTGTTGGCACTAINYKEKIMLAGRDSDPGEILTIDLETFTQGATFTMPEGREKIQALFIDPPAAFAYFTTDDPLAEPYQGYLNCLNLETMSLSLERALDPELTLGRPGGLHSSGSPYFIEADKPEGAGILKVITPGLSVSITKILGVVGDTFHSFALAENMGAVFAGLYGEVTSIYKLQIDNLSPLGSLTLTEADNDPATILYDPCKRILYVGTMGTPCRIIKINAVTMERIGHVECGETVDNLSSSIIEPSESNIDYLPIMGTN